MNDSATAERSVVARRPRRRRRLVRAALMAVAAILLIAGGLLGNALRMPSRQLATRGAAEPLIEVDAAGLAEILRDCLAVESYSYDDRNKIDPDVFHELHAILERRFPQAHRVLDRERINDLSLLYRWQGRDGSLEPMLLMSHLDVVPVEEDTAWVHDTATIADGFVWGRGALDVKCGVVGILAAVEQLAAGGFVPQRTIYLAFGHDEEVGGDDGNAVIAQRFAQRGERLAFVLDEGGAILDGVVPGAPRPVAFVAIAEKRMAMLSVTALGEGGHGSMPGRSAAVNLAELVVRIDQNPMPIRMTDATATLFEFLGPEMPLPQRVVMGNRWLFDRVIGWQFARSPSTAAVVRSTLNVTQLRTESAPNQTPARAEATINVRLLPGDTAEDARDHLLRLTDDLRLHDGQRAIVCQVDPVAKGQLVSPVDCAEFRTLQRTIHEVFPDVIVAAGLTSVSTDCSWYYDVSDKFYRFIPMRLKPEDVARIHGTNERIGVENLAEIAQFYAQLMRSAAQSHTQAQEE